MKGQGRPRRRARLPAWVHIERLEGRLALSMAAVDPDTAVEVGAAVGGDAAPGETLAASDGDALMAAASAGDRRRPAAARGVDSDRITGPDPDAPQLLATDVVTRGDRAFGFVLKFSEPLETTAAEDARNYAVFRITRPNKWLARMLYQSEAANAKSLTIRKATYVPEQTAVVLTLQSPEKLDGAYRVGVSNPARTVPTRVRTHRPPMITDLDGNTIAPPLNRRGRVVRTPILLRPQGRIRLEMLEPGAASMIEVAS